MGATGTGSCSRIMAGCLCDGLESDMGEHAIEEVNVRVGEFRRLRSIRSLKAHLRCQAGNERKIAKR